MSDYDEDLSDFEDDSLPSTPDQTSDRQTAMFATLLDSLPYACEPAEVMRSHLEDIISRLVICAEAKDWFCLMHWEGMLGRWLMLKYPIQISTRKQLVQLFYELSLLPGIEPRITRSWVNMVSRLTSNKGIQRQLYADGFRLSWVPLWRVLKKELFPKERLTGNPRNMNNIYLYLAEKCSRYFDASDIEDMLSTFLPMLTSQTTLTMMPVLTSFLPPTHCHHYLPIMFGTWESLNSFVLDDRLFEFMGVLSEGHVAGKAGYSDSEAGAEWKDVGIWTEHQWAMLMSKALSSMHVPAGKLKMTSTTSIQADALALRQGSKVKKSISRLNFIAKIFVWSMAVDGPVRGESAASSSSEASGQVGYRAGSKALDSLDKLITSLESFFHPSNHGHWSMILTNFLTRLTLEFSERWYDEQQRSCKTPAAQRLTPDIRRSFVLTLRTPALLSMFSKDPTSMSMAHSAVRIMAIFEPNLMMPQLLERAYGGLEVVNETHRTTAVLKLLSNVSRPLVSEKIWRGGPKHVLPLLELCIPGIDLNDPNKTVCTASFIVSIVQHIMIGDLSMHQFGVALSGDAPGEEIMVVDSNEQLPDGAESGPFAVLSVEEERTLTRESTAAFADWVVSLFRRVISLYENLPEEGGKKNTTGGKQEETVLKAIKGMLVIVCLHLSDHLYDLVLNLVYDYATTNAKSNAIRPLGHLVASLARARPQKTVDKFIPICSLQVREELAHGASSTRNTSTHTSVPSDTTLHWNLSILRGCLGNGGAALVKHQEDIVGLLSLLVEKTKSERGYSSTGTLVSRVLQSLTSVYPINDRFVNADDWQREDFVHSHNLHWGRVYEAKDVKIEWHVPSSEEISLALEIITRVVEPTLEKVDALLGTRGTWDSIGRNDFCRYLHFCRAAWSGLPTICREGHKEVPDPCADPDVEMENMTPEALHIAAGFVLTAQEDPTYQAFTRYRLRYGDVVHRAATALLQSHGESEDHLDAIVGVVRAIDTYFLDYGMTRGDLTALQKNYDQARETNRLSPRYKENVRLVWIKRAHVYHNARVYMHSLYRRRSELDDKLLRDALAELCLSPYLRVRRLAQSVLQNVCWYYVRATRLILPSMFKALGKGNEPDRMKGALYVLGNKQTMAYALSDVLHRHGFLQSLLESQYEEKPSVQKLVSDYSQDSLAYLSEELVRTGAYTDETPNVQQVTNALKSEITSVATYEKLREESLQLAPRRVKRTVQAHAELVNSILEVAVRPTTHWRYVLMAARFLNELMRRDAPVSVDLAKFFVNQTISPQPTIRSIALKAITKLTAHIKVRSYAKSDQELWLCEWKSPWARHIPVSNPSEFLESLHHPVEQTKFYVDKIITGFLLWAPSIKVYTIEDANATHIELEDQSKSALSSMKSMLTSAYWSQLLSLWTQETTSSRSSDSDTLRREHCRYIVVLSKSFRELPEALLDAVEPLLSDTDKFKQRAAAEILSGLIRGAKHWPRAPLDSLWSWIMSRFDRTFSQVRPDTAQFWEQFLAICLQNRDPRRNQPLVNWILALHIDFQGDSAFTMTKTLSVLSVLIDALGIRFAPHAEKYTKLLFENAHTGYAELRISIGNMLLSISRNTWSPTYPSVGSLLEACRNTEDPLRTANEDFSRHIVQIQQDLARLKNERLPPPRSSQSDYDNVSMTVLLWCWISFHAPEACLSYRGVVTLLPDFIKMSELNDNTELQRYSSGVLYVLSAVYFPPTYVESILNILIDSVKKSQSWRITLNILPALVVFFFRNLLSISPDGVSKVTDLLLNCLMDENIEVRETASTTLSSLVRCSERQRIDPLKKRFVTLERKTQLPARSHPEYAITLRKLHSAILGLCALIESFPYSVEPWMPPLTEVLARHSTDPPPISTTIRKCASDFKKTHQDTWHTDQLAFDEDQLQSLSSMLVGTSYYA
ncbi:hypothetical protein CONPUDRAFT_78796 [Coniophora puteana RWD-64-598 SS2]|uniref:ARM repeat-containing protein n=1 Tax=Coniophora puteana (strain RWD-64-598) TaxID=741705 RepID=A0A5M3N4U7_CONPW|nr:uncharacterized protein CONPUDRAFT_78796 [Coniophora puteana RWD-64-598 SS2]EIW86450.1 hypothetical protein CONPUDRAFT_78796 [Coniophora puteana RWD-64-598 SS2]